MDSPHKGTTFAKAQPDGPERARAGTKAPRDPSMTLVRRAGLETTRSSNRVAGMCAAALDVAPHPTILSNDSIVLFANASARRMLRVPSRSDIEGRPIIRFLHPDIQAVARERRALVMEQGYGLLDVPVKLLAFDGATVVTTADVHALEFGDGRATMVVYRLDMRTGCPTVQTPRYRTVTSAFEAALDTFSTPLVVHDMEQIWFANRAAAHCLGMDSPDDLVGRPIESIIHSDALDAGRERRRLFLPGNQPVLDVPIKLHTADGRSRHVRVDATPIHAGADSAALVWARAVVD